MKWLLYCNILMMIPLFSGCDSSENNNDTGTYRIYKEYLVDAYLEVEKMYVRQLNATTLELYFSGKKYGITSENASEVAKFKELAVKHNDDFSDYITVDFGIYRRKLRKLCGKFYRDRNQEQYFMGRGAFRRKYVE